MYTEARKIHLLEEVLKITNEDTLLELENVVHNSKKKKSPKKPTKPSVYDFLGAFTKKETKHMRKAIAETSEIINPDDWK